LLQFITFVVPVLAHLYVEVPRPVDGKGTFSVLESVLMFLDGLNSHCVNAT